MKNRNQYALIAICMLTNYVFMIPLRTKTTEDAIEAYLKNVHSTFGEVKISLVREKMNLPTNNSHS